MKMPGKGNLPVAILLMSTSALVAQDQSFPPASQQFNQAGSVSVDMATGEPIQPPQTTEILAIYRGPGYFDEALLEISSSSSAAPETLAPPETPETHSPAGQFPDSETTISPSEVPAPTSDQWANPTTPYEQGEVLPPPPVLPPPTGDSQVPQEQIPAPEMPPQTLPAQDQGQLPEPISAPPVDSSSAPESTTSPQSQMSPPEQEVESLPPPPMLDAMPAFPQGE
jgi:hypothetical protein